MSGITFMHPGFLWLSFLAALPPLIHLLGRRKPRKLYFPPFDFVMRCERRLRTRKRLRSFLLLAARTLLLLLIPAALARPYIVPPASSGAYALDLVIIDNSMSSLQSAGGETALERMKRHASGIAARASFSNRFLLITAAAPSTLVTPAPAASASSAQEAVRAVTAGYAGTSLGQAFSLARAAVESAAPASIRGHLLSDLASHGRREGEEMAVPGPDGPVPFEIYDPVPEPGHNLTPVAVEVSDTGSGTDVSVTVANYSPAVWKASASLFPEGLKEIRGEADVPPMSEGRVSFAVDRAARSGLSGKVVTGPDALMQDNTLHFVKPAGGVASVLVLSGDPRPVKQSDESFYFIRALKAGGDGRFRTWEAYPELMPDGLDRFDAVAMLNCGAIPAAAWNSIEAFVSNGGGLLVAAGDRAAAGAINSQGWMPASISRVHAVGETGMLIREAGHPALAPFGIEDEPFSGVRFRQRLELAPSPSSATILSTSSERPLLVRGAHGAGRIAIFGSTLDRDWNDWPIRPSYLPAMRALVKWLAGGETGSRVVETAVGEKRSLPVPACPAWLRPKQAGARKELPCSGAAGKETVDLDSPGEPGLYELSTPAGRTADVVVRTPPQESDLTKIPREEIETSLGMRKKSMIASALGIGGRANGGIGPASILLLAMMLVLAAEQWLTRRG